MNERTPTPEERNLAELLIPHYNPEAEAVRRFIAERAMQLMFDFDNNEELPDVA